MRRKGGDEKDDVAEGGVRRKGEQVAIRKRAPAGGRGEKRGESGAKKAGGRGSCRREGTSSLKGGKGSLRMWRKRGKRDTRRGDGSGTRERAGEMQAREGPETARGRGGEGGEKGATSRGRGEGAGGNAERSVAAAQCGGSRRPICRRDDSERGKRGVGAETAGRRARKKKASARRPASPAPPLLRLSRILSSEPETRRLSALSAFLSVFLRLFSVRRSTFERRTRSAVRSAVGRWAAGGEAGAETAETGGERGDWGCGALGGSGWEGGEKAGDEAANDVLSGYGACARA